MTEISVRKWVENDRTDVPHLLGFVKIIRNPEIKSKSSEIPKLWSSLKYTVGNWSKFGLKWVAMARFGLKMGGNESHEVQDHF